MKVIRLHDVGDLRLHDEPVPTPKAGEALVRVTAIGVCGSDLHWFAEGGIGSLHLRQPLVLGHEMAGVTQDGVRVAIDPAIPCGQCEFCLEGNPNLCSAMHFAGNDVDDGSLREYMTWPTHCLFPIPDALSDADGAMLEPFGVAIHAMDLAHLRSGMTVGVFGCGPIGLMILQLAKRSGAIGLYATDVLPHRLDVARSYGAQTLLADGHEAAAILAATNKRGVDVAFEVAGVNEAVEAAVAAAKPGGKVMLVGIPADDRTAFNASAARRKGLTIKLVRRMKLTYPRAIRLVESGRVDVRSLVTARFPLEQAAQAFAVAARREGVKVVIG